MYCAMSPSSSDSAAVYSGFPPFTPDTSPSCTPPNSEYCCHRSVSICSAADKNRNTAMSPCVRFPSWRSSLCANNFPGITMPAAVAAPAAVIPFRKNERRLLLTASLPASFTFGLPFLWKFATQIPNSSSEFGAWLCLVLGATYSLLHGFHFDERLPFADACTKNKID